MEVSLQHQEFTHVCSLKDFPLLLPLTTQDCPLHKCKSHSLTIHWALIQQGAPSLAYSDTQCSPQYSDGEVDQSLPNLHFLLHRTVKS